MDLYEQQGNLIKLNNIISPSVHTEMVLRQVFSFDSNLSPDIIDLFKKSNYKVIVISDNEAGIYDQYTTLIFNKADNFYRVHSNKDSYLLPTLKKSLIDNKHIKNKIIILDTLGNHLSYKDRCDIKYYKNSNVNRKIKVNPTEINTINDYDNAVRCWDSFMNEVIKVSDSYNIKGVLYFSDHGEEVKETIDFIGHAWNNASLTQIEIPFFIYTKDIELKNLFIQNKNKLWNSKNFIHFIHSYLDIKSNIYESNKDILSTD